ncbi:MAG: hypothetical protein M1826_004733 [Phylliscum demangeonii]|nr:MAG: hypothetical protein M1826_004733 [Phylliscum demangeonii]
MSDPVELDHITTLPNGLRIATEALPGHFSGIGVYIGAGSRYEDQSLQGASHLVDRLAFKSTKLRSSDEVIEAMESLGGNIQCASSRESLMYQSATFNASVPTAVALLAESIRDSLVTEEEVQQQLQTAEYEIGEIWSKPELILPELVHTAAYKDNTLGNPLLCPQEKLGEIDKRVIDTYRRIFFKPERMVIAFAGVSHDEAVTLTERYFGDMQRGQGPLSSTLDPEPSTTFPSTGLEPSTAATSAFNSSLAYTSSSASKILSKIPLFKNLSTSASQRATVSPLSALSSPTTLDLNLSARYTGGFLSLPPIPPPANPALPRLSHLHVAFEGLPISSDEIYALATLQTLLGGGGSFSAGGPGKGMYSRLYTNVLNQCGWVESCVAFNHSYSDSGLFGISASCQSGKLTNMLEVICRELHALTLDSGSFQLQLAEVQRAKNSLRSSLLMNLESRMIQLEDLGRQVQVLGQRVGPTEMCQRIEALTIEDIRAVARKVLRGLVQNAGGGSEDRPDASCRSKDLFTSVSTMNNAYSVRSNFHTTARGSTFPLAHASRHKPRRWPLVLRFIKGAVHTVIIVPLLFHTFFALVVIYIDKYVLETGLALPSSIIPSLSIVVGLILVFRNQTSYDQFQTGRNCLTQIVTSVRNLTRSILCSSGGGSGPSAASARELADTERTIRILIAILYSIKAHLRAEWGVAARPPAVAGARPRHLPSSSEPGAEPDDDDEVEDPKAAFCPTSAAEFGDLLPPGLRTCEAQGLGLPLELTFFVEAYLQRALARQWMAAPQASQLQGQLNNLVDAFGKMETIRLTPLPVAHLIHQKQVLALFCCILPFAMVASMGWWAAPIVALITFTLYGIEGIGLQLEDPFGYERNDIKMDAIVEDSRQEICVMLDEWRHTRRLNRNDAEMFVDARLPSSSSTTDPTSIART